MLRLFCTSLLADCRWLAALRVHTSRRSHWTALGKLPVPYLLRQTTLRYACQQPFQRQPLPTTLTYASPPSPTPLLHIVTPCQRLRLYSAVTKSSFLPLACHFRLERPQSTRPRSTCGNRQLRARPHPRVSASVANNLYHRHCYTLVPRHRTSLSLFLLLPHMRPDLNSARRRRRLELCWMK